MGIIKKVKDWLASKSSNTKTTTKSTSSRSSNVKKASGVTYYGGGKSTRETATTYGSDAVARKYKQAQKKKQEDEQKKKVSAAFKATAAKDNPDYKISSNAARKDASLKEKAAKKANREAFAAATKKEVDSKYFEGTKESKLRLKQGEYMSDPLVAKYEMAKNPVITSAARGGISGATFGLSELLAAKAPRSEGMKDAEKYYQQNKSKTAEIAGELGTSLASFGLTSGASKAALTKIAPKTAARLGESATERIAANKLVQNAARREALRKLGATATEEQIAQFARSRASKIVAALGEDAAINLTTGAVSDVTHALIDSDNPVEFAKNIAMNVPLNLGLGAVTSVAPGLRASEVGQAVENEARQLGREAGQKLASEAGNVNLGGAKDEIDDTLNRLADEVEAETKATKGDAIENDLEALRKEVESEAPNENAGKGERTEFKRSDEKTAKEEARTKRTQKNQKKATQESFDKDFAAFEKKVSEHQAKADELRAKIRSADTKEEKAALKEQLDALNSDIKKEYNKASMRYHPDRGGSNEWMGKFNSAYDDYKRGSYQSRRFKGAESTTRAKTATGGGGGGNTPPPRRAAAESGGFKKPKGKARKAEERVVYKGEDTVFKRKTPQTTRERATSAGKDLQMKVFDSHSPFEKVARKFAKTDPQRMQNSYGAINRHRSSNSIATKSIYENQLNYKGDVYEKGKSLKDIYSGMDEDTEKAFDYYLYLKHAPDRAREGTPIWKTTKLADGRSLNDPKTWEAEVKRILKEHPEFEARAEDVYQYTRNELQNLVDSGMVSQETASKWMHDHPFYVPSHRDGYAGIAGNVDSASIGASEIKAAKGSDLDLRSIRDQLEEMTRQNWEDITLNDMLKDTFRDRIPKDVAGKLEGGFAKALDNNISVAKSANGKKFYAEVLIDGKRKRFEIEKEFVDGLQDWAKNGRTGHVAIDTANEAFGKVAKYYKSLITEWNPIFMIKNPLRDIPEAYINSRQSKEFLECFGPAFKDLKNGGEFSTALKNSGISQSTFFDLDKALMKELETGDVGLAKRLLGGVGEKLEAGNQFMEMLPRLAEYMATFKKAGIDITKEGALKNADIALRNRAAANAADVTVNFGRSGSLGKALNKGYVPFFNPSAQGWSKFARNFTEQPGAKAYLSFAAKATALGVGVTAVNNYWLKDNKNYQQISARDKANNLIIPVAWPPIGKDANTTDTFIKIPMSRFASVFSLPAVNWKNENKFGEGKSVIGKAAEIIKVANDQVAPVNPIDSHILSIGKQVKDNETWYGTPIVSESIENKTNPSQEYDVNTSWFGKQLGKATEKLPTELQISPKKADYVMDQELGIIGDVALPVTTPSRLGGGKGLKRVGPALVSPVKKAFTIDSTTQNNLSTRFYDQLQVASDNNSTTKAGEAESEEYKRMNAYSTEISGINKAIKELQGSTKETKLKDVEGLQKYRNELMQSALDGKAAPSSAKTMDKVQKYVGTTYAVNNFGSESDKRAMQIYGEKKYGNLSEAKMQKKIDADKNFYKGVQAIGKLDNSLTKAGLSSSTSTLAKSVALASVDADDDLFGAYKGQDQSRTESAHEMDRARTYFKDGGSTKEFVKMEKNRQTVGKLPKEEQDKELEKLHKQLSAGKITQAEYDEKEKEIKYNANTSYIGKATSLAQGNCPLRGYKLYDIKDKNIQKGMNLAAMGYSARDYYLMKKEVDADGNGYLKTAEIKAYVANSGVEDKATLYNALYTYNGSYNPFGTPTNYSRKEAAYQGKAKGVEWITDEMDDVEVNPESSGSGYGGYRRRGYRRYGYGRGGGGGNGTASGVDLSAFKAKAKAPDPKAKEDNLIPLDIDTVKSAKTKKMKSSLEAAMKDIQKTQKKVAPPKARRS